MNKKPEFKRDDDGVLWFCFGELTAGGYHLEDSHKPFIHPLNTPAGYTLSLGRPHDHPHHKALMFAFQTETHNYWEEYPLTEGAKVGVQVPAGEPDLDSGPDFLACRHILHWRGEEESASQLIEERSLQCSLEEDSNAFIWKWESCLTPCVDVQLVKSPFSPEIADGTRVNYHGLGIRFRREFGCTGGNEVRVGESVLPIPDALGRKTTSITYRGSIDEIWPVPQCEVTFSSPEAWGVFTMDSPFAYLAYGPSVLEAPLWKTGESINLKFAIRVADVPSEK